MARLRLAILISGRGSNMQTLLAACRNGAIAADPCLVLSNRAEAAGLAFAEAAGVPTRIVSNRAFGERLTTLTDEQAVARSIEGPDNKGREAALAAVEMATLYRRIGEAGLHEH